MDVLLCQAVRVIPVIAWLVDECLVDHGGTGDRTSTSRNTGNESTVKILFLNDLDGTLQDEFLLLL